MNSSFRKLNTHIKLITDNSIFERAQFWEPRLKNWMTCQSLKGYSKFRALMLFFLVWQKLKRSLSIFTKHLILNSHHSNLRVGQKLKGFLSNNKANDFLNTALRNVLKFLSQIWGFFPNRRPFFGLLTASDSIDRNFYIS